MLLLLVITPTPVNLKPFRPPAARPGNYRVLFELEGGTIVVYDVGDRKDIYE
jgi:hypothetical protein